MIDISLRDTRAAARPRLEAPRAHLVGIRGAGMRSLANLLDEAGWRVSGSDLAGAAPDDDRFDVRRGHDARAIELAFDVVVHSDAVPRNNPELRRAEALGIETLSYSRMLARLMQPHTGVAVAGTHGKSTTTAMASEILLTAELDPTYVVGATSIGGVSGGHSGRGRTMVVEACEYRANFCQLQADIAAVLNVEPDHFDWFESHAQLKAAFRRFVRQVPSSGLVLARADCATTTEIVKHLDCTVETFGMKDTSTWQARNLSSRRGYYSFELCCRGQRVCAVKLPVPGRHNVYNAVAAAALASHCGASAGAIRTALESFTGLRRRLQLLGEVRDVALVDDYAHHPTEVAAAIAALREMYPGRRLICAFQPHQASRLAHLLDEFARSLENADKIVVADVFAARESSSQPRAIRAEHLAERLQALGCDALHLASAAQIVNHLKTSLLPGDVLVTMGAGDIGTVAHELGKGLRTFRKAG